jgi:hypothetical protein
MSRTSSGSIPCKTHESETFLPDTEEGAMGILEVFFDGLRSGGDGKRWDSGGKWVAGGTTRDRARTRDAHVQCTTTYLRLNTTTMICHARHNTWENFPFPFFFE